MVAHGAACRDGWGLMGMVGGEVQGRLGGRGHTGMAREWCTGKAGGTGDG